MTAPKATTAQLTKWLGRTEADRKVGKGALGPEPAGMRKPRARRGGGETGVVKAVRAYLALRGLSVERRNTGVLRDATGRPVRFGQAGAADLSATLPGGRRLEIEVKAAAGKLRPAQRDWLLERHAEGAVVLVVRPADWRSQIDAALAGGGMPAETRKELGI